MSAQPTVTVHDYLSEVWIFHGTSPEFTQAAADLGVSASLATFGEGASLLAAIRNELTMVPSRVFSDEGIVGSLDDSGRVELSDSIAGRVFLRSDQIAHDTLTF